MQHSLLRPPSGYSFKWLHGRMSDKPVYEPPYLHQPRPQSRLYYNRDGPFTKSSQTLKYTHRHITPKVLLVSPESRICTHSVVHCFPPHQFEALHFENWMCDNRAIVWALPQGGFLDWALVASLRANQLCPKQVSMEHKELRRRLECVCFYECKEEEKCNIFHLITDGLTFIQTII